MVSLRARPIRWISKFVERDGLNSLVAYLKSLEGSRLQHEHEELCIKCLKSLMNNKHGLTSVMGHAESLVVITLSLRSPSIRTRTLVLEILGAVCLIPGGHPRILDAMSHFAKYTGERARFDTVVHCLTTDISAKGNYIGGQEEKIERVMDLQVRRRGRRHPRRLCAICSSSLSHLYPPSLGFHPSPIIHFSSSIVDRSHHAIGRVAVVY